METHNIDDATSRRLVDCSMVFNAPRLLHARVYAQREWGLRSVIELQESYEQAVTEGRCQHFSGHSLSSQAVTLRTKTGIIIVDVCDGFIVISEVVWDGAGIRKG